MKICLNKMERPNERQGYDQEEPNMKKEKTSILVSQVMEMAKKFGGAKQKCMQRIRLHTFAISSC